jgi:hypothetical protein
MQRYKTTSGRLVRVAIPAAFSARGASPGQGAAPSLSIVLDRTGGDRDRTCKPPKHPPERYLPGGLFARAPGPSGELAAVPAGRVQCLWMAARRRTLWHGTIWWRQDTSPSPKSRWGSPIRAREGPGVSEASYGRRGGDDHDGAFCLLRCAPPHTSARHRSLSSGLCRLLQGRVGDGVVRCERCASRYALLLLFPG